MLDAIRVLLKTSYPQIYPGRIFGHREVNQKTQCPGNQFLDGWKNTLLQ